MIRIKHTLLRSYSVFSTLFNAIIGHLNVNSLRNKFAAIDELIKNKIDICLISETKVDESFPNQQFKINGYKLFRKDRDRFDGGAYVLCQ